MEHPLFIQKDRGVKNIDCSAPSGYPATHPEVALQIVGGSTASGSTILRALLL